MGHQSPHFFGEGYEQQAYAMRYGVTPVDFLVVIRSAHITASESCTQFPVVALLFLVSLAEAFTLFR